MLRISPFLCGLVVVGATNEGEPGCPCLEWSGLDEYVVGNYVIYQPAGSNGPKYNYNPNYGSSQCQAWDLGLPPNCDLANGPGWCAKKWCYVDKNACNVAYTSSLIFPNEENLFFSYATCANAKVSLEVASFVQDVEQALESTRRQLEGAYLQLVASGGPNATDCNALANTCGCSTCQAQATWGGQSVDFARVGASMPTNFDATTLCLNSALGDTFLRVAASVSESSRIGYQYYGDQMRGAYVQWPQAEWCPRAAGGTWDPRFRPWYTVGAAGPKDVVIVLDVSGSMGNGDRIALARRAGIAILDTLSWIDFAGIVLFDDGVEAVYSEMMMSVTPAERTQMQNWLNTNVRTAGGTSFYAGLSKALDIIENSVSAGRTAFCEKAILFLTDGQDSSFSAYAEIRTRAEAVGAIVFTYSLGSGADTTKPKTLACQNKGIFYPVPDGGDLATIMSSYYKYFAAGSQTCEASWVKYQDPVTSTDLYAGCLPVYDRRGPTAVLLGVTCIDANIWISASDIQSSPDHAEFACKVSTVSKKCRANYVSECALQKLRLAYSASSVCDGESAQDVSAKTCQCVDASCADDPAFVDEKGYYCDTWVGDSCERGMVVDRWGYSEAGYLALIEKCKRSCGMCNWVTCPLTASSCAEGTQRDLPCRDCRLRGVSGVDIEGQDAKCLASTAFRLAASPAIKWALLVLIWALCGRTDGQK